jgi:hypothetical protein
MPIILTTPLNKENYIMAQYISNYAQSKTARAVLSGVGGAPKQYVKGGEYGRGTVVPSANPTDTDIIILNGVYVQFTSGSSDGTAAGTLADPLLVNIKVSATLTVDELVSVLNGTANASIAVATYSNVSSGTFTIIYDTLADSSSYTIDTSGLTATPTSADTALTGGQAAEAITLDNENIDVALTDTNDQYFTLADGKEFQRKVIAMTAKGTGNAVVTPANFSSGTTITFDTDGDTWFGIFINGSWKTVASDATVA